MKTHSKFVPKKWLALLLTVFSPGLGHVYVGEFRFAPIVGALAFIIQYTIQITAKTFGSMVFGVLVSIIFIIWMSLNAMSKCKSANYPWHRILVLCLLYFAIFSGIVTMVPKNIRAFSVSAGSMLPTLFIGDRLMADMSAYKNTTPSRGDIVVHHIPDKENQTVFLSRVIGIGGDTLAWDGQFLKINGEIVKNPTPTFTIEEIPAKMIADLPENFVLSSEVLGTHTYHIAAKKQGPHEPIKEFKIPENSYYVLGDNRDNSFDSRFYGPISTEQILGKALFIWLNLSHISRTGKELK